MISPLAALTLASKSIGVPLQLLVAICTVESGLHATVINQYDGDSPSYGLCQVKHNTAKQVGFKGNVNRLLKADVNASVAAKYLKHQLIRYKGNWKKAISAYNRGTAHPSNRKYVNRVLTQVREVQYGF